MDQDKEPENAFTSPLLSPSTAPDSDLFTRSLIFLLWVGLGQDEESQKMEIGVASM